MRDLWEGRGGAANSATCAIRATIHNHVGRHADQRKLLLMARRSSPAAAARARLAAKYDAEAKIAQDMADLKRPDTRNPASTHFMDTRAAAARTNARRARRKVGPRGERVESVNPELVAPPAPESIPARSWDTNPGRKHELWRRSLNEDLRLKRKQRRG